jgi:hypothetical protein
LIFLNIIKKGINILLNDFYTNDNDDIEPVINIPFNDLPKIERENECEDNIPLIENRKFDCVDDYPLAMAYVPFQRFENLYPADKGYDAGTLFMDLDKPYHGHRIRKGAI